MSSGDIWIGQVWGADLVRRSRKNANIGLYYLPEEGGVRGSDTDGDLLGRHSTRSPRTCSSTTCSTRR